MGEGVKGRHVADPPSGDQDLAARRSDLFNKCLHGREGMCTLTSHHVREFPQNQLKTWMTEPEGSSAVISLMWPRSSSNKSQIRQGTTLNSVQQRKWPDKECFVNPACVSGHQSLKEHKATRGKKRRRKGRGKGGRAEKTAMLSPLDENIKRCHHCCCGKLAFSQKLKQNRHIKNQPHFGVYL